MPVNPFVQGFVLFIKIWQDLGFGARQKIYLINPPVL